MKNFISILLFFVFTTHLYGQGDCAKLQFSYDNAGNRVKRFKVTCFADDGGDVAAMAALKPANTPATSTKSPITTLNAFPNPNNGIFQVQIENPQENGVLDLYDFTGRKMYSQAVSTANVPMNVSNLVIGTYLLVYRTPEKIMAKLKFVID
jgi:Secretion system C-terminal sorting domain